MEKKIIELDLLNKESIDKFNDFYNNVFSKSFLDDEIGTLKAYLDIKRKEYTIYKDIYEYHLVFMEQENKYIGCFIYMWFPKIQMIAAEFGCVDKEYRKQGICKELMDYSLKRHNYNYMFGEVEKNNTTNLKIWSNYGFKKIPIDYVQLSLGDNKKPVNNMVLCLYNKYGNNAILLSTLKNFIFHYYKYSQFCEDPYKTETMRKLNKIKDSNVIFCEKLI